MVGRAERAEWASSRSSYRKWIPYAKKRRIRWLERCRCWEVLRALGLGRARRVSSPGRRGRGRGVIGKGVGRGMTASKTTLEPAKKVVPSQAKIEGTLSYSRKLKSCMDQSREQRAGQIRATRSRLRARRSIRITLLTPSFSNKIEIMPHRTKAVPTQTKDVWWLHRSRRPKVRGLREVVLVQRRPKLATCKVIIYSRAHLKMPGHPVSSKWILSGTRCSTVLPTSLLRWIC